MKIAPNYTVLLDSDDKTPVILQEGEVYRFQFKSYHGETDDLTGAFREIYKKQPNEYQIVIDTSKPFKQSTSQRDIQYLKKIIPIAEWEESQAKKLSSDLLGVGYKWEGEAVESHHED